MADDKNNPTLEPLSAAERDEIKQMRGKLDAMMNRAPIGFRDSLRGFVHPIVLLLERAVADIERLESPVAVVDVQDNRYEVRTVDARGGLAPLPTAPPCDTCGQPATSTARDTFQPGPMHKVYPVSDWKFGCDEHPVESKRVNGSLPATS